MKSQEAPLPHDRARELRWSASEFALVGSLLILIRLTYWPTSTYAELAELAYGWVSRNFLLALLTAAAIAVVLLAVWMIWLSITLLACSQPSVLEHPSKDGPSATPDEQPRVLASKPDWWVRRSPSLLAWLPRVVTWATMALLAAATYTVVTIHTDGQTPAWLSLHLFDSIFLFSAMFILTVLRGAEVAMEFRWYERGLTKRSRIHKVHRRAVNPVVRFGLFSIRQAYFSNPKVDKEMGGMEEDLRGGKYHYGGPYGDEANDAVENLKDVRFSNIYTAMFHGLGTSLTVALGIPSLILGLVFGIMPFFDTGMSWSHLAAFFVYVIWFCFWFYWIVLEPFLCWLLRTFVLTMPAGNYASLVADALESSQLMVFINFKVHRLCQQYQGLMQEEARSARLHAEDEDPRFQCLRTDGANRASLPTEDDITAIHDFFKDMLKGIKEEYQEPDKPHGQLDRFLQDIALLEELKTQEREKESARIEILIKLFADRHGLRYEEVCENIFQFSPQLFRAWAIKYRQNALAIVELLRKVEQVEDEGGKLDTVLYDRLRRMCCQNKRFMDRVGRIMRRQVQSIALKTLHNDVVELASTRSSSDAVKVYIRGLAELGRRWLHEEGDEMRHERFAQRCAFIFFKSRAHVGMSVHDSLWRLVKALQSGNPKGVTVAGPLKADHLLVDLETANFKAWAAPEDGYGGAWIDAKKCQRVADAFTQLHPAALSLLDAMRAEVIDNLGFEVFQKNKQQVSQAEHIMVLTFGFSKMVRDAVRNVFAQELSNDSRSQLKAKTTFVVLDLEGRTQESIRLKYMMAERKKGSNSHIQDLLVADIDFVLDLVTPNTLVYVLMGADTYQKDRNRVLRTSHGKRALWKLYRAIALKHGLKLEQRARPDEADADRLKAFNDLVRVRVLAESYKRVDALLPLVEGVGATNATTKKALFLNDHYHSADIYDIQSVPFEVITDSLNP